jgi:ribosomal protein L11 methyltransferase
MFSLEIEFPPDDCDLFIADLWEQGSVGIVELSDRNVRAFFEDDADRDALLRRFPDARLRIEEECDWVEASRELLQPMTVGRSFFLVPEWRDDPAPEGRFRIRVNPGQAFGTGVHETTRLCLEALEDYVVPGMSVLDVGTGSGILARAAALLGAARVFACDTDIEAVEIAGGASFVGSVDGVATASVDLAVANISPEAVVALAPDLLRVVRRSGILLVSGFEIPEVEQVAAALPAQADLRTKGNWALLACTV